MVTVPEWEAQLKGLIEAQLRARPGSRKAADILQHWDLERGQFHPGLPERDAGQAGAIRWASKSRPVPAEYP